jgi:plasmid stabilization system protein ParE
VRIRFARRAVADVESIADYVRRSSPSSGKSVEKAIRDAIRLLSDFPKLGRERAGLGVRMLNVPRYPYTVYYRLEGYDVWIIHVRDGRRRPLEPDEL